MHVCFKKFCVCNSLKLNYLIYFHQIVDIAKKFTEEHEWVSVETDIATVGITNYAQNALGDVVFVEVPEVDKTVKKGGKEFF